MATTPKGFEVQPKRSLRPRRQCPDCGRMRAVRQDGHLQHHWKAVGNLLYGGSLTRCGGDFRVAELELEDVT